MTRNDTPTIVNKLGLINTVPTHESLLSETSVNAQATTIVPGEVVIIAVGTASISDEDPVINNGTIIITGTNTTLIDSAPFVGFGIFSLISHATLDAAGTLAHGTIDMGGNGADTLLDLSGSAVAGGSIGTTIINFGTLDTIQLTGFTATSSTYVSGVGLEVSNGTITETINIAGSFAPGAFTVLPDAGGTEILLCYLQGTKILTPAGEIPVEDLAIGDAVITRFGGYRPIKWIGRQSYARRFAAKNRSKMPVRIGAGALAPNTPTRDLWISPGHSMLLGGILVLAECLVNGVTITQDDAPEDIHYYQLEFETHDCVMADGAWSESFADGPELRDKFHNAASFYAAYPDYMTPERIAMCAERPSQGPMLETIMRQVISRAGPAHPPGELCGYIDHANADIIEGWAIDITAPDMPVLLEIFAGNRALGTVLACGHRPDVAAAGLGQGWCHFTFPLPPGTPRHTLRARRATDGADLPMTTTCKTEPMRRQA